MPCARTSATAAGVGPIGVILGLHWVYVGIMENKTEATVACYGYIGIMENKMETAIVYSDYIGIMENKTETNVFNNCDTKHTLFAENDCLVQAANVMLRGSCLRDLWNASFEQVVVARKGTDSSLIVFAR